MSHSDIIYAIFFCQGGGGSKKRDKECTHKTIKKLANNVERNKICAGMHIVPKLSLLLAYIS